MRKIITDNPSFENLITNDFIYVDKTDILYDLITSGSTYFCSRPRRFGRTLTLSTLEAIFKGRKELFKGLKIYDMDYDWKEYPVIHIDLSSFDATTPKELKNALFDEISSAHSIHN